MFPSNSVKILSRILLILVLAWAPALAKPPRPSLSEKQVVREAFAAMDRQDYVRFRALTPEDAVIRIVGAPEPLKVEALIDFLKDYWKAVPDTTHTIQQILAEGGRLALQVTCQGTHKGGYEGVPATGKRVAYTGAHFVRVEKGQIREWWVLDDSLGMMQQLGLQLTPVQAAGSPPRAGAAQQQSVDNAEEVTVVRKRYSDWLQAEKRRDLDAAISFLAPDAVVQGGDAPAVKGLEGARALWTQIFSIPYTDMLDTEPRTVVVSQSGDMAYDVGNFKIILPGPNGATGVRAKSLVVWQKREGQWKAVVNTFSMDAPAAPEAPSEVAKK